MKELIAAAFLALSLAGCATGGLSGTSTASLKPNQYAAPYDHDKAVAGIVGGGLISGGIGAGLDRREKRQALEAEYTALETAPAGVPVSWGSQGEASGQVIAAQPYSVGSQNCRQYTQTVGADNSARTAKGTACRNADGSWTVLN